MDIALILGAPMIRLFCGQPLTDPEERKREIRCFQEVGDYGLKVGIAMGLQNHPSTGDDVIRIFEETDRPNFGFLFDTGQWCGSPAFNRGTPDPEHDIYEYMKQTAHLATHVRAKFYKIDSGREEWLDYERIVEIISKVDFNGNISIVFEGQGNQCSDREAIGLAVAYLRGLLAPV